MRKINLYDTYLAKVREFVPIVENNVDIYYCGPTVYNYVHLGNFRPTVTFDLLTRVFKECGYNVRCVSNYTDIDDKIIKQAKIENKSEKQLSQFYIDSYSQCLDKLNILPLFDHPKASDYIDKMAEFIKKLEDKGYAYRSGNDIYFRVSKIGKFGALSKQNISSLNAGSRVNINEKKENPLDFALWKLTDDDGIKFDTCIGLGRPGWHTECVVMVNSVFKKTLIDIHGGGFDLKFPHHENEIAQSEALNNTHLANYWMHVGFLLTNGEKMSKSLGNSILAKDVLEKHSGNCVRMFFLMSHYRAPVNYSEENLLAVEKIINKYESCIKKAKYKLQLGKYDNNNLENEQDYNKFMDALCDDLNVSNALAVVDKNVKELNTLLMRKDSSLDDICLIYNTLNHFFNILGCKFEIDDLTSDDIDIFIRYNLARENKDFQTSDQLRPLLMQKGII